MSNANNENEELYVIEYKELLFFLFIFIFILVTLFPKELVKRELFDSNNKDYRLSLVYIEDLLKKEPNNTRLKLLLVKKALQAGENDLAFAAASKLMESEDKNRANEALLLAYEALKQEYFKADSETKKARIQKRLAKLFAAIYAKRLYDDNAEKWYKEAQLSHKPDAALFFLKKILHNNKIDLERIKEAYYLALALRRDEEALRYLDILIQRDIKESLKWKRAKYYLLLRDKKYTELERFLRQEARSSLEFAHLLARFYLMRKEYIQASNLYLSMMERSKGYKQKKDYFIKAVDALRAGGYDMIAARVVKRFEQEYLHEEAIRKYMLKVYLAANRIDLAHALALKTLHLLKKERR